MSEYSKGVETERTMKDQFMAHHAESPFVAERVDGFTGLRYFSVDESFRVTATLARLDVPAEAYLRTNRDGQAVMRHLGDLVFRLAGRPYRLRVFHAGEGVGTSVFVPFRDSTSGAESYGPGRYLTLELNESDEYEVDFNRAFNPYCAYTDAFECAFPPAENDLPVAIRAGEKVWSAERNPASPESAVRALLSPHPAGSKPLTAKRSSARSRGASAQRTARNSRATEKGRSSRRARR
jgi:uncharacterized protein